MNRIVIAALLACTASSAGASIPPSYRIAVVAQDRDERALGHALVEYMVAEQAFFRVRDQAFASATQACLKAEDPVRCVRREMAEVDPAGGVRTVVIVAAPAGEGRQRWQCIGAGNSAAPVDAVDSVIDLQAALFGSMEERSSNLRSALRCIQAAANESSPR